MIRRAPLAADRLDDRLVPAWGLDPAFGTGGTAVLAPSADGSFQPSASLPLADGSVIVAGTLTGTSLAAAQLAVLKLTPTGAPDTAFNGGRPMAVPGATVSDPSSVRLATAGGKLLLAADTPAVGGTGTDVLVVRLNANGAVDGQFGINGGRVLTADLDGTPSSTADLRTLPDGRVAVLATVGGDVAVTVLNGTGTPDSSFGTGGTARLNLGAAGVDTADTAAALAVQSSTGGGYKLIVAGTAGTSGSQIVAARLTSTGVLDPAFGTDGRAALTGSGRLLTAGDVAVDDSGKVVLLGRSADPTAGGPGAAVPADLLVARLTADGRTDTAFGTAGRTSVGFVGADGPVTENTPADLSVLSGGGLLVTGSARTAELRSGSVYAANDFGVARLTAAGQPDEAFGTGGQLLVGFDQGTVRSNDLARSTVVLPNGDILLVGDSGDPLGSDGQLALARLSAQAVSPPTTPPTTVPPTSPPPATVPPASPPVVIRPPTFAPADGARVFNDYPLSSTRMTAAGDITGDGVADYLYSTGAGLSRIKLVDGATGGVALSEFNPYERSFGGGINAVAADLDGDGRSEIVVAPDNGGAARVQVFKWTNSGLKQVANYFAIDDTNYRGGATLAVADLNADGKADVLVGAANGGGPRVAVFDGKQLLGGKVSRLVNDFFGLPDTNFRGGVSLAAADFDGDGQPEIAVAAGPGGGSRLRVLKAAAVLAGTPDDGVLKDIIVRGEANSRAGVTLATRPGADGKTDLLAGTSQGQVVFPGADGEGELMPRPRTIRRG